MPGGEFLRNDQRRAVNRIIRTTKASGAEPLCGILFGSRARGEARPDSDIDLVLLLRFPDTDSYLKDPRLLYTRHFGHTVVNFSADAGRVQAFLYNGDSLIRGIENVRLMPEEGWVRGLLKDGQVIYGEEPKLNGRPFLQFLKERIDSLV